MNLKSEMITKLLSASVMSILLIGCRSFTDTEWETVPIENTIENEFLLVRRADKPAPIKIIPLTNTLREVARGTDSTAKFKYPHRAELVVRASKRKMRVTLKNLTDKPLKVDKDMELHFRICFYDKEGNFITKHPAPYMTRESLMSERFITLQPNQSLTKEFKEGDIIGYYDVGISDMQEMSIHRHCYRMPSLKDVGRVEVEFCRGHGTGFVPSYLADKQNCKAPEISEELDAAVEVTWILDENARRRW